MKNDQMHLFTMIKNYLTLYLPKQKKASNNTIKSYRETINLLLDFLCRQLKKPLGTITIEDIRPENVELFAQWLHDERECMDTSLNQRLSAIRAFLKYCGMKEPSYNSYYLAVCSLPRRKAEKRLTVDHFSENALQAMLTSPDPKKKTDHRDQFYMLLLYDTGARNQEILDLRIGDFSTIGQTSYVTLHGKGNKIRTVPVMQETMKHLSSYLARFHKSYSKDDLLFYTTVHGVRHQMSDDNVARFIDKYASIAREQCPEVPQNVTPHMFRHSRALHLYRNGVPLPLISEWLGHSNIETTLIYAYADTEMKRAAIEKATAQNHPVRNQEVFDMTSLDEDSIKRLYGLKCS